MARGAGDGARRGFEAANVKGAFVVLLLGLTIGAIVYLATSGRVIFLPLVFVPLVFLWPRGRDRRS